tara:strand:+ start:1317 stop:1529 length:213 start_codon:yes stop_codon:yes gene_type:complete
MGAVWLILLTVFAGYFVMILVVGLLKHLNLLQYFLVWESNAILIYIVCTLVTYIIMQGVSWRRKMNIKKE